MTGLPTHGWGVQLITFMLRITTVRLFNHLELALNAVTYRTERADAARQRAQSNGYSGAFWPWESGVTGLDTAPWRGADLFEHHISADIPLSWQKYFYVTGDVAWLNRTWPALRDTCVFWECRFQRTDSVGGSPAGFGPSCSAKDGSGNFTVHNVISPDESSGVINDSIYTNAAAAKTLEWCMEVAPNGFNIPPMWKEITSSVYLPFNNTECPDGPVHQNYAGYKGQVINQADVALLQYPLQYSFPQDIAERDLDFWANRTDFSGMFTGDGAYGAAYLALGRRAAADQQLIAAFPHIEPHYNVFKEKSDDSGTQHFITGSGGLLQDFLFGYGSLRISEGAYRFASPMPLLPPLGIQRVTLRGIVLYGSRVDVQYDNSTVCVRGVDPLMPVQIVMCAEGVQKAIQYDVNICVTLQKFSLVING
eukprot:PhF_6_TR14172/c0_g1_i2/m.22681/K22078/PGGHG, ATHL1; protein-glucosylgalactosylhydroxylysine glucosidase